MLRGRQKSQLRPESQNLLRAHTRITHCVWPCQLLQAVASPRIPGPPLLPGPGPAPQPRSPAGQSPVALATGHASVSLHAAGLPSAVQSPASAQEEGRGDGSYVECAAPWILSDSDKPPWPASQGCHTQDSAGSGDAWEL